MKERDWKDAIEIVEKNIIEELFYDQASRKLFWRLISFMKEGRKFDLFDLAEILTKDEETLIDQIVRKKINIERYKEGFVTVVEKMLEREWMRKREALKNKIQQGAGSEEEVLVLAKEFDALKKQKPKVQSHEASLFFAKTCD